MDIDEAWRPDWFETIPQSIRAPSWTRHEDLPRDVLVQIPSTPGREIRWLMLLHDGSST